MDAPVPQASGNCARTVKSCGPDLPTLGSSPERWLRATVA